MPKKMTKTHTLIDGEHGRTLLTEVTITPNKATRKRVDEMVALQQKLLNNVKTIGKIPHGEQAYTQVCASVESLTACYTVDNKTKLGLTTLRHEISLSDEINKYIETKKD